MILTCDPGLKGAFALVYPGELRMWSMPVYTRKVGSKERAALDEDAAIEIIKYAAVMGADEFVIEKVGGVQGQSASAAFTFGYGVGVLVTAARLQGMRIERVPAVTWKRALKAPADKQASRARASELMPQWSHLWPLKSHEGRAEAAMIGYWRLHHDV
jgi:hypothetical protein